MPPDHNCSVGSNVDLKGGGGEMSAKINAAIASYAAYNAATSAAIYLLIARITMGVLFIIPAIRQITSYAGTIKYFASLGFPAPEAMVVLAVVIELVAGTLIILGWKTRWAAWLLVLYVIIATAMAHRFWQFPEAQQFNQLNHLLKNLAVIGGLLYVITFGPGRISVEKS
jgi:putative oxidoreductase